MMELLVRLFHALYLGPEGNVFAPDMLGLLRRALVLLTMPHDFYTWKNKEPSTLFTPGEI